MNSHAAMVVEIDDIVEEAVMLEVGSARFQAFASYCPYEIEIGKLYLVEFDLVLPDCINIELAEDTEDKIEMIGSGFNCLIIGKLQGSTIKSIVDFQDLDVHYERPDLNDKRIKLIAERVDVSFGDKLS
ncbi:hypothetical protein RG836_03610 [Pseudomonas sp. SZMC_28357]|uniref:hypothetical protein n=1 Tax=Pseudomonas sp. SZMC_28357 TaxID=3074380 RepID=UPI002871B7D3|nr:hypothetical protein [Pseudomonas sp. SZMC_28357]MDR9750520.1 hypothetical protein [Pseudomonas sp. SZMC_28357]